MPHDRPFRFFAGMLNAESATEWQERVRAIEALGYAGISMPDHFGIGFAPLSALAMAAAASEKLRLTCTVFANDFRHPVVLAHEVATIDVLSGGRFEFGLGAGWKKSEFDQAGIAWDAPGVRVRRMKEALRVVKGLWGPGPYSFDGQYYRIQELDGVPKPAQEPTPPIFIGGGGKHMLWFAAREATTVGIMPKALPGGGLDASEVSEDALARKVEWVREAAGERFDDLELSLVILRSEVTDARLADGEQIAAQMEMPTDMLLTSPYFAIGSVDEMAEQFRHLRDRLGVSHFVITPDEVDMFAPVVARLAS